MKFTVSGMTCGGCINAVTKAIQSVDDQAQVKIDLVSQTIELETQLSSDEAQQLIAVADSQSLALIRLNLFKTYESQVTL